MTIKRFFKSGRVQAETKPLAIEAAAIQAVTEVFGFGRWQTTFGVKVVKVEVKEAEHLPGFGGDERPVWTFRIIVEGDATNVSRVRNDRIGYEGDWVAITKKGAT